jgi:hypothetical protein
VVVVVTLGGAETTLGGVGGTLTGTGLAVVLATAPRTAALEVLLCAFLAATMDGWATTEEAVTTVR